MADAEVPIKYMDRTRHYYRALGYTHDYIWATFNDVPFSQPAKPLSEMRIVLITTASPPDFDGVKRVWSGYVSPPPPKLFTDNVAWDKESTHTNDRASFLPIEAASELASEGSCVKRLACSKPPKLHELPSRRRSPGRKTERYGAHDTAASIRPKRNVC
jgi:D-proline reductase (dithiol) PrdB